MTEANIVFDEVVRAAFAFMEARGFAASAADPRNIVYQNGDVKLSVGWTDYSYEIEIYISPKPSQTFSLQAVLNFLSPAEAPHRTSQVGEARKLAPVVGRLADTVRTLPPKALSGDASFFAEVDASQRQLAAAEHIRREIIQARATADKAWRAGDYAQVVGAFNAVEPHLSDADRKKLDLARRRV
ncbi:MAG: hypothetical protein ABIO40_04705 [Devosia sp.]